MEKATDLVFQVLARQITIPALNKWTKLAPAFRRVLLVRGWCGVLPDAFRAVAGVDEGECQVGSLENDGPVNVEAFRALAQGRASRAALFLGSGDSLMRLLIWHSVCGPLMRVHYRLFAEATWHSHQGSTSLVDFLSPGSSPAVAAMEELGGMVFGAAAGSAALDAITAKYGPASSWNADLLSAFQSAWLLAASNLWRRLIHPWAAYPWKLWAALDPNADAACRLAAAQEFCNAPTCCLDREMSLKLRELVGRPEDLVGLGSSGQTDLHIFLTAMFKRAVATSTYIERDFAQLSAVSRRSGQGIASLAAKHMSETLRRMVEREKRRANLPPVSFRRRPSWVKPHRRGCRLTGMHLFQKQMCPGASLAESQAAWGSLSPAEQEPWLRRARGRRAIAAVAAASEQQLVSPEAGSGPWALWDLGEGFPLSRHLLQEALSGGFKPLADAWRQEWSNGIV